MHYRRNKCANETIIFERMIMFSQWMPNALPKNVRWDKSQKSTYASSINLRKISVGNQLMKHERTLTVPSTLDKI